MEKKGTREKKKKKSKDPHSGYSPWPAYIELTLKWLTHSSIFYIFSLTSTQNNRNLVLIMGMPHATYMSTADVNYLEISCLQAFP